MSEYTTIAYSGDACEIINQPFISGEKYDFISSSDKDLLAMIKIATQSGYTLVIKRSE